MNLKPNVVKPKHTPAVNFDSRNFNGHCSISSSSIGGGGGFHRTK